MAEPVLCLTTLALTREYCVSLAANLDADVAEQPASHNPTESLQFNESKHHLHPHHNTGVHLAEPVLQGAREYQRGLQG